MVTHSNPAVVVDASGFLRVCAWCLSAQQLAALGRAYHCTHGLCVDCRAKLEAEAA